MFALHLSGADAHAHRPRDPGRADASADGRGARPQRAAASSCWCSRVGSALAGLAGVIGGFMLLTAADAWPPRSGPIVFVVVVVGGMGSLAGAFIASLLIGILQTFAVAIDYSLLDLLRALGVASHSAPLRCMSCSAIKIAQVAPIMPYLLLVLMLIVRPRGPARHARRHDRRAAAVSAAGASRPCAPARRRGRARVWLRSPLVLLRCLRSGLEQRLRPLAVDPDGHRGGVRAVVQHAARTDRPVCRSATRCTSASAGFAAIHLHARDQPGTAASRCRWCRSSAPPGGLFFGLLFGSSPPGARERSSR